MTILHRELPISFSPILLIYCSRQNIRMGLRYTKHSKKSHLYSLEIDKFKNEFSEIMLLTRGARHGLRITETFSSELSGIGVQGSRAHAGVLEKYNSALIL